MYYGQQELDRYIYDKFFPTKLNGFFVECGAYDGVHECTCKFFESERGWSGVNIEPVPIMFERLVTNRPDSTNLNIALSDTNETKQFTEVTLPGYGLTTNGSLTHSAWHMGHLVRSGGSFNKYDVSCKRFDSLRINNEIDLFVLDVEGHEAQALAGIMTITNLPKLFCIEYTICGMGPINKALGAKYNFVSTYHQNGFWLRK